MTREPLEKLLHLLVGRTALRLLRWREESPGVYTAAMTQTVPACKTLSYRLDRTGDHLTLHAPLDDLAGPAPLTLANDHPDVRDLLELIAVQLSERHQHSSSRPKGH